MATIAASTDASTGRTDQAIGSAASAAWSPSMEVRWITPAGFEEVAWTDVPALLARDDGFVWVDVLGCDAPLAHELSERFGFQEIALHDIFERNYVSKLHPYPDHLLMVLHAPDPGETGHIHLVELDQFIGATFLITTHGPVAPGVVVGIDPVQSAQSRAARSDGLTINRGAGGWAMWQIVAAIVSMICSLPRWNTSLNRSTNRHP